MALVYGGLGQRTKDEHLTSGNEYLEAGRYQEAIVEYLNAIRLDPQYAHARLKLAEAYAGAGDPRRASQEYIRAADLLPEDRATQLIAGSYLLLARQFEDARTRIRRVVDAEPQNVEARILLGRALAGLRDFETAIAAVEEAIELDPSRAVSYANLAQIAVEQGRRDRAWALLRRAVAIDPESVPAWLALANFQLTSGDTGGAEGSLQRVLEMDPEHAVAHRALGALFVATNRPEDAEPHLRALASADGAGARLMLADYYLRMKRRAESEQLLQALAGEQGYETAVEMRLAQIAYDEGRREEAHARLDRLPADAATMLVKSKWLLDEGDTAGALEAARAAVVQDPQSVPGHYMLGTVQVAQGDLDGAVESFTEVLRLNPTATAAELQLSRLASRDVDRAVLHADNLVEAASEAPTARVTLTRRLLARGDLARAEAEVGALLQRYPNAAIVHALNGRLLGEKHDLSGARHEFEAALRLDRRSFDAIEGIVALDLRERKFAAARELVDQRLRQDPDRPELLVLLGRIAMEERDMPRAEEALERAIALDPTNTGSYSMLAQVYLAQRKLNEALAEFDGIVARNPRDTASATMAAIIVDLQGRRADARARYEAILALDARAGVAANSLAWIYAEEKTNLDKALELAKAASEVIPRDPAVLDTLGWVYYNMELPVLAIEAFEQSLELDPGKATYHYHLALALAKTGQSELARSAAETALGYEPDLTDARRLIVALQP